MREVRTASFSSKTGQPAAKAGGQVALTCKLWAASQALKPLEPVAPEATGAQAPDCTMCQRVG